MKILSLKALNINSLRGLTEINFSKLTQENALFAITGPTGSGKSTILDIISCALYGQTARLKKPPNNLMSRHTGEAFCEVEFEIKGKHYRSSWSQKRAYKKPDGAFQSAKMELVDLDEDKILPLKTNEVPAKIEELSGLDFGRFTQSMLLAQGGFDAFLKAGEKERSELLEKITQTQVYAEISKAIYDKHKEYQQEIDLEQKMLASIDLLDHDLVELKQQQLSQNIAQKAQSDLELKRLREELSYLQKLSELRVESKRYEEAFLQSSKLKEDHGSSFEKLALATKALNISSIYRSFSEHQTNLQQDKIQSQNIMHELTQLQEDIALKEKLYKDIKENFYESLKAFEVENKNLKMAREILVQEREIQRERLKVETLLQTKKDDLDLIKVQLDEKIKEYKDIETQIALKKSYITTHLRDEKLLESLGLLKQKIEEYKKEKEELLLTQSKLEVLKQDLLTQESLYTLKEEEVQKLSIEYKEREISYTTLEKTTSDEFELEESTKSTLSDIQEQLRTLKSYTHLVQKREKELEEYEKNSDLLDSYMESKKHSLASIETVKKHIATLREKYEREQLLKKYEEDRAMLVEGEECYLCGSLEHPYIDKEFEVHIDKTKESIDKELSSLETKEKIFRELELRIGVAQTKKESSFLEIEKLNQELDSLKVSSYSEVELKEREEEYSKKLEHIKQDRLKKAQLLIKRDSASKVLRKEEESLRALKTDLDRLVNQKETLLLALKRNDVKIRELSAFFETYLKEFGLQLDLDNLECSYEILEERKLLFIENAEAIKKLEIALNRSNILRQEDEITLKHLTNEMSSLEETLIKLEQNVKTLSLKRVEILNVADLDLYEEEIKLAYKKVQEQEQDAKNELHSLHVKYKEKEEHKKSLDIKIEEIQQKVEQLKVQLEALYEEYNFKNTKEFQSAMLESKELEELALFCKNIEDRYNQTKTLKREIELRLQEHESRSVSGRAEDEIEILLSLLEQKVESLQESIGSEKKELELNQLNSDKFQKKITLLKTKEEEFKVWVKLNELVGSADGTKFKKFAQGITLDQLINLANEHLKVLSTRYKLSRNETKLLELEVIDAYQGDVVRPVSTLSGGESFIVSLALALGLSELASQKISIDSLFLDEGFGTLDEESLDTALNALNLLQNGGKMVGVISHVEALKERIPLQIKVIPKGDGSSFIESSSL